MQGGEIYISVEEEPIGECEESPQEGDEFEDGKDEEPDLCVKEGESVASLYVMRRAMIDCSFDVHNSFEIVALVVIALFSFVIVKRSRRHTNMDLR
uniref:Uncharacterized protein n=1 Tax=Solanum tuberosum TaxID=4113 RepID=M1DR03_SOLTU